LNQGIFKTCAAYYPVTLKKAEPAAGSAVSVTTAAAAAMLAQTVVNYAI